LIHVWVGDSSGSIILQCWGKIYGNLRPGDMLRLYDAMAVYRKNRLVVYLDRSAKLIRYGQDELLFAYTPNMSHVMWEQTDKDQSNWVPVGEQPFNYWHHLPGTSSLDQKVIPWKYS
jgi:hypothetical protein